MAETLIEVINIGSGKRQIGPKETILKDLQKRRPDLEAAITAGVDLSGDALSNTSSTRGWHVSEFEVKFGISLTAEAGVIVSRAGGEASFEVSVKITREH